MTALFAVLFLIGASVWADTLRDIKHYADPKTFMAAHIPDCMGDGTATCQSLQSGNFGTLNVSVVCFGFEHTFFLHFNA